MTGAEGVLIGLTLLLLGVFLGIVWCNWIAERELRETLKQMRALLKEAKDEDT